MLATLSTPTPATARDDAIAFDLRYASRHLAGAQAKSVSREAALNVLRAAALNALSAVAVSLDRRTLTQEMIYTARLAVAAVLDQIQPVAEAIGYISDLHLCGCRLVLELAIIPSRNQFQRRFEQRAVADLGLVLQPLDQRLKERSLISRQQRLREIHQETELRGGE